MGVSLLRRQPRRCISRKVWDSKWDECGGRCTLCGIDLVRGKAPSGGYGYSAELDHILPLRLGGSNKAYNLRMLCRTCNRSRGR